MRAEQPLDAAARGRARPVHPRCLSLLPPEPPLHMHGRKREFRCPPLHPLPHPHFRSKITATLQAPQPVGEGESGVCSQLSALLRLRAILFAARVPLRLDRRFWSCLWAQHWPYTGFSGEIGLEWIDTGAEPRAVPATMSCFIRVNMMLLFIRLI